jgi:multidrug resistance efflux pump
MDAELKAALDAISTAVETHTRRLDQLEAKNEAAHAETRHQFEIIAEAQHDVQLVAEGVAMTAERLDRLEAKVDRIEAHLDTRLTHVEAVLSQQSR